MQQHWFDTPTLGHEPPDEIELTLEELEDDHPQGIVSKGARERFRSFEGPAPLRFPWQRNAPIWLSTGHAFGYLAPALPGKRLLPVRALGAIRPDLSLRQSRIIISLDRLCIKSYPGRGTHRVLVHFYAQNQLPDVAEDLHFNALYRVRQGEQAAIRGYPVFIGLCVGASGIRLRCRTINIGNEQDEAFLHWLESDTFKCGLKLAQAASPLVGPFSEMAFGIAKTIAGRHRNISVQDIDLGLDFSTIPTGARLAEGAYVAVQIPEQLQPSWDWDDWAFQPSSGQIVQRSDPSTGLPYNFIIFSIRRYQE